MEELNKCPVPKIFTTWIFLKKIISEGTQVNGEHEFYTDWLDAIYLLYRRVLGIQQQVDDIEGENVTSF